MSVSVRIGERFSDDAGGVAGLRRGEVRGRHGHIHLHETGPGCDHGLEDLVRRSLIVSGGEQVADVDGGSGNRTGGVEPRLQTVDGLRHIGGGTLPLLARHSERDPAASITGGTSGAAGTAGTNATAEGAGTFTPVVDDCFNNLTGYIWVPAPGEEMIFSPSSAEAFVMRCPVAPTGTTLWQASVTFEEV